MNLFKIFILCLGVCLSPFCFSQRKEIREVDANDKTMKTINLTLGRSTVLSFYDKPVKVVSGNSNYFNIEYIGNDLTIQPLANVETNLFVYTQSKRKYAFLLRVGSSANYDDIVYVRWKSVFVESTRPEVKSEDRPLKPMPPTSLKISNYEVNVSKISLLRGTVTYLIDFELKNKGLENLKTSQIDLFASRNSERLNGQKLFFEKETLAIHESCKGRLFLPIEKKEDFSLFVTYQKLLQRMVISKIYL
jgi:hypothetical protein